MGFIYFIAVLKTLIRLRPTRRAGKRLKRGSLSLKRWASRRSSRQPSTPLPLDVAGTTTRDECILSRPEATSSSRVSRDLPTSSLPSIIHHTDGADVAQLDDDTTRLPLLPLIVPAPYCRHANLAPPAPFQRPRPTEMWSPEPLNTLRIGIVKEPIDAIDIPLPEDLSRHAERDITLEDWTGFLEELMGILRGQTLTSIGISPSDIESRAAKEMILHDCVGTWNARFFQHRGISCHLELDSEVVSTTDKSGSGLTLCVTTYDREACDGPIEIEYSARWNRHSLSPSIFSVPGPYRMYLMELDSVPQHFMNQSGADILWSESQVYKTQRCQMATLLTSTSQFLSLLKERDISFAEWALFASDVEKVLNNHLPHLASNDDAPHALLLDLTLIDLVNTWSELFFQPKGIKLEIIQHPESDDSELLMTLYDAEESCDSPISPTSLQRPRLPLALGPYEFTITYVPHLIASLPLASFCRPPDIIKPWPLQRTKIKGLEPNVVAASEEDELMPAVLKTYDVMHEEWIIFIEHLNQGLLDRLHIANVTDTLPFHDAIISDIIECWNHNFFHRRRLEVLYDDDEDESHDNLDNERQCLYIQFRHPESDSVISLFHDNESEISFGPAIRRSLPLASSAGEYAPFPLGDLTRLRELRHLEMPAYEGASVVVVGEEGYDEQEEHHDDDDDDSSDSEQEDGFFTAAASPSSSSQLFTSCTASTTPASSPSSPIDPPPLPKEWEWNC